MTRLVAFGVLVALFLTGQVGGNSEILGALEHLFNVLFDASDAIDQKLTRRRDGYRRIICAAALAIWLSLAKPRFGGQ